MSTNLKNTRGGKPPKIPSIPLSRGVRPKRTGDGAVDGGAILQLDGDRLVVQLHQEPADKHTRLNQDRIRRKIARNRSARRGAARNQSDRRGEWRRRALPDELHRGGGREEEWRRRESEELELFAFSEREGQNPSLKADLAEDGGWWVGLLGPGF